jgi:hypothetical protein
MSNGITIQVREDNGVVTTYWLPAGGLVKVSRDTGDGWQDLLNEWPAPVVPTCEDCGQPDGQCTCPEPQRVGECEWCGSADYCSCCAYCGLPGGH